MIRPLALAWLAGLLLGLPRHAEAARDDRPNILVIVWDTVRADRLTPYGYARPTTPRLAQLAGEGQLFERAVSPGIWTIPSHASMFTGLPVGAHGAIASHKQLDNGFTTFAELLGEAGYDTWAWSANPFVGEGTALLQGFQIVRHPWKAPWRDASKRALDVRAKQLGVESLIKKGSWAYHATGGVASKALRAWLDEREGRKPYLAFVNLMEAHDVRQPGPDARKALMTEAQRKLVVDIDQKQRARLGWMATGEGPTAREHAALSALYDASIRELDSLTGLLLDRLSEGGHLDDTIVVIVSDHGEALGEHGVYGHQFHAYNTVTRVPFVVWSPGRIRPERVTEPVSTTTLFDRVLGWAGVEVPTPTAAIRTQIGEHDGVFTEYLEPTPDAMATLQGLSKGAEAKAYWERRYRAVEHGPHKLIAASDGWQALFDVIADPAETSTLDHDTVRATLARALRTWRKAVPSPDPEALVGGAEDDVSREALQVLGYVEEDEPTRERKKR